jgi:aryl sulfotransferase
MATKAKALKAKSSAKKVKPKAKKPQAAKAKTAKAKSVKAKPASSKSSKTKAVKAKAKPAKAQKAKTSKPKIAWPVKTREMHNHHMNSTVWNNFKFRDDDIVIATYAKSGTTWMQQIVSQLVFSGAEGLDVSHASPWVDLRIMPPEAIAGLEHLPHRRFVKTHLPVDALVFSPKAKYIYVGRDGRDAVWSMYNHHVNANEMWYGALNDTPGRVGPPIGKPQDSIHEYYQQWMNEDGHPFWPYWENIRSWWAVRDLPNVMVIHFNDLKADLPGSIRKIGNFLGIKPDAATLAKIVEHCSFDYMKAHAELTAPLGGALWNGGAKTFINKGTNGRWRDVLTAADNEAYRARAVKELGAECAKWLEH